MRCWLNPASSYLSAAILAALRHTSRIITHRRLPPEQFTLPF